MNAKVRILYSQLLSAAELAALSEAPDLAALLETLKRTAYGHELDSLKDREPTKEAIYAGAEEPVGGHLPKHHCRPRPTRPVG